MTRRSFRLRAALGATGLLLAACEPNQYLYAPSTTTLTSAEPAKSRTADYPFPPDSPQGDIRLATFGLEKLSGDRPAAVELRMIVHNRSPQTWVIDTREQKVVLKSGGDPRTLTNAAALPTVPAVVEVPAGQNAVIELSFDVPLDAAKPKELPAFDAVWTVHIGDRAVTTTTTFERLVAPGIAKDVPTTAYPLYRGTPNPQANERLPGTPDHRWNENLPIPQRGLE